MFTLQLISRCWCINFNQMKLFTFMMISSTVSAYADSIKLFKSGKLKNNDFNTDYYMDEIQLFDGQTNKLTEESYATDSNITYSLFTRSNLLTSQIILMENNSTVKNSYFNGNLITVFLVHGWNGNGKNFMNVLLTKAFLEDGNINVIVVDWGYIANKNYITAKAGVPAVGKALGQFMDWLVSLGTSYNNIHLVGFSLGAHVVGIAGRETGSRTKRITALDPGGPMWKNDRKRLTKTDALYVEVIHTNTALYGLEDPCGHADFYPNGGYRMPGCILNYCSHRRAYEYMAATLRSQQILAYECSSLQDAFDDTCQGTVYPMGNNDLTKSKSGIFRVNTEDDRIFNKFNIMSDNHL